jgi:hypothetical protein
LAREGHLPFFGLDGDAGIIADALAHAGEGVEECGFAGVGIAEEGDGEAFGRSDGARRR